MNAPPEAIARVRELYERSLYLQAYAAATALQPLREWSGPEAVLAGRLAAHVGGMRLGTALILQAWRRHPRDPEATYYAASALRHRRGPWVAWRFLHDHPLPPDADPSLVADGHCLVAALHADFRDFDTADALLHRAEDTNPGHPWTAAVRAEVLAAQDRYDEALEVARAGVARHEHYVPAIRRLAQLLIDLGRYEEALASLAPVERHGESGAVSATVVQLLLELERESEVEAALERCLHRSPLLEKDLATWVDGVRCDAARQRGDLEAAILHARRCATPFHTAAAEHMTRALGGSGHERVRLTVPYERQFHLTCAPSSLAAITRFWSRPTDALEMARAVTYEGTPGHRARAWLTQAGWITHEFRVTDGAARALLSRGVPFTLVTVHPGNAHEQVVAGYDAACGTWLVHDPGRPFAQEVVAEPLIEEQTPFGVRGLALVPPDDRRLDGVLLPDAALFDTLYELDRALEVHDRDRAAACARRLAETAPDHVLALAARRRLADYDGDSPTLLECAETASVRFPACVPVLLARLSALHEVGRHAESAALLEESCRDRRLAPFLAERHAHDLSEDARRMPEALHLVRRALRTRPLDPAVLSIAASVYWRAGRLQDSLALRRFATSLDDTQERLVTAYFTAARHLGQAADALAWLRRRHERHAAASTRPARTLFWALEELGLADDGFEVLDEALGRTPDGELLVWAAETYARYGREARAQELLERAQGRSRPAVWLRAAARLAALRGDLDGALALWRRVQTSEPLAVDAHGEIATFLAALHGQEAALDHLRRTTETFPHHHGLHSLHYDWIRRDSSTGEGVAVLRRMIEHSPRDAWARRELAVVLADQRNIDGALTELEEARALEPSNAALFSVRGYVLVAAGRVDEAREAYREAVRLDVNLAPAIHGLLSLPLPPEDRRDDLAAVHAEIVAQRLTGDSLSSYHRYARGLLPPEEVLGSLRAALDARRDMWQAWSAFAAQLRQMNELTEAASQVADACERFPLVPSLWMDRAYIARIRGRAADERHALETALASGAEWTYAARRLAEIEEQQGNATGARRRLEQAVVRAPLDAENHAALAERHWSAGDREAALARLERAIDMAPDAAHLWSRLHAWYTEQGAPAQTVERARARADSRPGDASCWMVLAHLQGPAARDEALAALDRAIQASPRLVDAYDMKAEILTEMGRFDDAVEACRAAAWGDRRPRELRGREAWIAAARGDVESAIRQMRALVEHESDYFWGWSRLADWYDQTGSAPGYAHAAEQLARIAPHHATSLGYRGDARRRQGRSAEARADFERSLELDADYRYGRNSLAELHLDEGRPADALAVLDAGDATAYDDHAAVLRIAALDALHRRPEAADAFRRMLAAPEATPGALEHVALRVGSPPWRRTVDEILAAAHEDHTAAPRAARLAVLSSAAKRDWNECRRRLEALTVDSEAWRLAASAYMEQLGQADEIRALRAFVAAHPSELRATASLWGGAGYALSSAGADRDVRTWMDDWQARSDVAPWMLLNLALSLRRLGSAAEAAAVHRAALALPADGASPRHAVWLAVDEALSASPENARAFLERTAPEGDYDRFLQILAGAIAETRRGEQPFAWFRGRMEDARRALPTFARNVELRRAYRLALWRVARDRGGVLGTLWALLRLVADR